MLVQTPQQLARLVRARRKELSLTQSELADLAGVSLRFVFDLENEKPTVALDRVRAVTKALGLVMIMQVAVSD